jgi:hypothetical protein
MENSMSESRFGPDTGLDKEETSVSSDVRSGYDDDDQPAPRVEQESGEEGIDSHAADVAAGYEDESEDDDNTLA